jgi:hypothetical protein
MTTAWGGGEVECNPLVPEAQPQSSAAPAAVGKTQLEKARPDEKPDSRL